MKLSFLTIAVSKSIPAKFTLLDAVFESDVVLNVTAGNSAGVVIAIGLVYSLCPNGPAVIGYPSNTSTLTYFELFL